MITDNNWRKLITDNKTKKHLILKLNISGNEKRFATDNISVIDATTKYAVGTVNVTNLSKSLAFTNSSLLGNVFNNDFFRITSTANSPFYKISDPSSATSMSLQKEYLEETSTGNTYEILTDFSTKKFSSGLESISTITSTIDIENMSSSISSIQVSIDGSYRLQDLRDNYILSNVTAELSLWADGQLYQDRLELSKGVMRNISWGDDETPFDFTIIDLRKSLDRKFPSQKITTTNFALASDQVIGNSYPVLYGSVVDSPCYYLGQVNTDHRWLVAGHDMNTITTTLQGTSTFTPSAEGTDTDADGNTYYYVESATDYSEAVVVASGEGVKNGSTFFSNAGEILEDMVTNYSGLESGQIDTTLFGTAKNKLTKWQLSSIFNGHDDSESTVFETIQKRLAPQLPTIPVWRNGKYGIIVIDLDNPVPVIKLKENKNIISRVNNVAETDISLVFNSFEINYGYSARLGDYTKYKKLSSSNSQLLSQSQGKYGLLEAEAINSIDIQEDVTADRLLEFKALLLSDVSLLVTYLCTQEASRVEEGDYVSVTDSDQNWTDKLFICVSRGFNIDTVELGLREIRWTESS